MSKRTVYRRVYPVDKIRSWIHEGKTQRWIAVQLGMEGTHGSKLIYKVCKKHGIKCHRTGPRSGSGHPEWKGGRVLEDGYVKVYLPDHPSCVEKTMRNKKRANGKYCRTHKYAWEHRVVMEKHLGRYLRNEEVVHHKNGNRSDNRIDNLELFGDNSYHLKHELMGRCPNWSEEGKVNILRGNQLAAANRRKLTLDAYLKLQKIGKKKE